MIQFGGGGVFFCLLYLSFLNVLIDSKISRIDYE